MGRIFQRGPAPGANEEAREASECKSERRSGDIPKEGFPSRENMLMKTRRALTILTVNLA